MQLIGSLSFQRLAHACPAYLFVGFFTILIAARSCDVQAKKPGESHCYRNVCVTVLTVREVEGVLGKTMTLTSSFYDDPSVDRFNRGTFTSNGERFRANDPTRTASANFPDGTELLLRNPKNGHVSHVRVNNFGPFWPDRELDVTLQVAKDLGFVKDGLAELEVTIVAPPREDDIYDRYRQDRKPIPTLGYLGVRSAGETAQLAKILLQRLPAEQQKIIFSPDRGTPGKVQWIPQKATVFHYVFKQPKSSRAAGAEVYTDVLRIRGEQAMEAWQADRQTRRQWRYYVFVWAATLLTLSLLGPIVGSGLYALYLRRYQSENGARHSENGAQINLNTEAYNRVQSSLSTIDRKERAKRRQIMKLHNVDFDESYVWPQLPVSYGSARPPPNRSELDFDIDYIWPNDTTNALEFLGQDLRPDAVSSETLEQNLTDLPSDTDLSDLIKDGSENIPAHERLRRRLDRMRNVFDYAANKEEQS